MHLCAGSTCRWTKGVSTGHEIGCMRSICEVVLAHQARATAELSSVDRSAAGSACTVGASSTSSVGATAVDVRWTSKVFTLATDLLREIDALPLNVR
ncbi:hypothetical protein EON66_11560 [archaeon]|nr:MAG: hypothetical protein EON66_11560 [archaeon]